MGRWQCTGRTSSRFPRLGDRMRQILPPQETAGKICGEQEIKEDFYRLSRYVFSVPCEDGVLLYHTITGELLQTNSKEWEHISCDEPMQLGSDGLCRDLARQWFMVPTAFDEYAYARQFRSVEKLLQPILST